MSSFFVASFKITLNAYRIQEDIYLSKVIITGMFNRITGFWYSSY